MPFEREGFDRALASASAYDVLTDRLIKRIIQNIIFFLFFFCTFGRYMTLLFAGENESPFVARTFV